MTNISIQQLTPPAPTVSQASAKSPVGHGSSLLLVVGASLLVAGCAGKAKPAGEPVRPPVEEEKVVVESKEKTDCDKVTVGDDFPAFKYDERSLEEADNLADRGFGTLRAAEQRGVPRSERERMVTHAVEDFIKSLIADPYNVHATYNLAAAYARIDRHQCSINLLQRLVKLRRLRSQTTKVEAKLDRLLGRKKFDGKLDPDFENLRDDERFREVVIDLQKRQP